MASGMKRPATSRSNRRRINLPGFLLAAVSVSPISFWLFVVTGLTHSGLREEVLLLNDLGTLFGVALLLTLVVTAFGIVPAVLFGATGLWMLEAWRAGRVVAPWVFATAGSGSALLYVGVALAGRQMVNAAALASAVAPWAEVARAIEEGTPAGPRTLVWIICCIVAAGAIAGLIYERFVRSQGAAGKGAPRPVNDEQG